MSKKSQLLLDSNELITLQTQLAIVIGDRAAIALQQIHYWCDVSQRMGKRDHYHDEQWWAYNTWTEWHEKNFPFWSVSTIRRIFRELETIGVIITRPHPDHNKGFWITVNYGALEVLARLDGHPLMIRRPKRNSVDKPVQNEQATLSKMNRLTIQTEQATGNTETTETRAESSMRDPRAVALIRAYLTAMPENSRPSGLLDNTRVYEQAKSLVNIGCTAEDALNMTREKLAAGKTSYPFSWLVADLPDYSANRAQPLGSPQDRGSVAYALAHAT